MKTVWTLVALLGAGCATEEAESEAVQDISIAGGATWSSTTPLQLGPTTQQTCWLDGVMGELVGGSTKATAALASVYPYRGWWYVRTQPASGGNVTAHVKCVNVAWPGSSHEIVWTGGGASPTLPSIAGRHCFLREVWSTSGLGNTLIGNPQIVVEQSNGQWTFSDSYLGGGGADAGGGTAVCIDVATAQTWDAYYAGPVDSYSLPDNNLSHAIPTQTAACGLRGIGGSWAFSGSANLVDDANVLLGEPRWFLDVSSGKGAYVRCVR
jgi:hypothetical protein